MLCAVALCVTACPAPPLADGGLDVDASVAPDASFSDAGENDAGHPDGGCTYRVIVLDVPGAPRAITPDGETIALVLDESTSVESTSALWSADGGLVRLRSNVRLTDGGLHFYDGGVQDLHILALSNGYAAGTVFNSSVPQTTPFRMRIPSGEAEVLGDAFGQPYAVNGDGTVAGAAGDDGVLWFIDGGVVTAGAYAAAFQGIDNGGYAAGWRRPVLASEIEAFVRFPDGGTQTLNGMTPSAAGAVTATRILGGQRFWRRPSLDLGTLEIGPWQWGGATVASADGVVVAGAVGPRLGDALSGYAAVWRGETLLWVAPHDPALQIGTIVGVSADGTQLAGTCERPISGPRHACRVVLNCVP